ncbi:carbohydrate kinase family protein [Parvibium lacunae]|uniref:Carbohydrate kinase family protein n=1 Tax=Parvibium lacunae TaxID=1888893 RepID=A0A368L1Y7_9BURK|nr:carbohydrate kinase family protein [Parvibium lacunae]RCS57576.1 carbohydrate kinase family protein [Parvibium lacunae]
MRTLICGSIAYDNIMVFPGHFKDHIMPDQVHILNVAFLVPQLRREFGGTGANIAYNLKMLGGEPVLMGTIGMIDGHTYRQRFLDLDLDTAHIRVIPGAYTAQAFITTDLDDNQITAFHPGAMNSSHLNRVSDARDVKLGIVSPDGKEGMLEHCQQFAAANIPFIFDPGQGLPMFNGSELLQMAEQASYITLNDYEAKLFSERTGLSMEKLAQRAGIKAVVVTLGSQGSQIYHGGQLETIPVVAAPDLVDPTGCGDAFRSGLLYGIATGMDWPSTGRLASLMGSIKIASQGAQNHHLQREHILARFKSLFGYAIN